MSPHLPQESRSMSFTVHYVIVGPTGQIVFLGEDRDKALASFDATPGAKLERADSLETLTDLINGRDPRQTVSAQYYGGACDTEEPSLLAEYVASGLEILDIALKTFLAEAARQGVTQEKISTWINSVQDEGSDAAKQAQAALQAGVNKLSGLLANLNNHLKND